ncbi:hypothetical protein AMTRI_Chr06g175630 [Amborella trichopoda]
MLKMAAASFWIVIFLLVTGQLFLSAMASGGGNGCYRTYGRLLASMRDPCPPPPPPGNPRSSHP